MPDQNQDLTFEAIDAHVKKANLKDFEPGGAHHFAAGAAAINPGDVLKKVCAIYHVIRPILQGILHIPFIPSSWKKAIQTFVSLMDGLCPGK